MRDHTKLSAFQAADALALAVYRIAADFPSHERFGLAMQLRRAAVSAAANIVEGCARETAAEYARFLSIAYASAREVQYEIDLAVRLGYVDLNAVEATQAHATSATKLLSRLVASAQAFRAED
jgi:four helix bundle protein